MVTWMFLKSLQTCEDTLVVSGSSFLTLNSMNIEGWFGYNGYASDYNKEQTLISIWLDLTILT